MPKSSREGGPTGVAGAVPASLPSSQTVAAVHVSNPSTDVRPSAGVVIWVGGSTRPSQYQAAVDIWVPSNTELSNSVLKDPSAVGGYVGNVVAAPPVTQNEPWLQMQAPFSAGDSNPDMIQLKSTASGGTAFRTSWFNGNNEFRCAPSTATRVGFRAFELQESVGGPSTSAFVEFSTNPTISANREALMSMFGSGHATKPGWAEFSRVASALLGLRAGGSYNSLTAFTIRGQQAATGAPSAGTWVAGDAIVDSAGAWWLCTVGGTPGTWVGTASAPSAFVAVTPGTNMSAGAVAAASRLETGGASARLRGTLTAGASISANATIGTITAAHRPLVALETAVRYSGGGAKLTISTGGLISIGAALANAESVFLGAITWDLAA